MSCGIPELLVGRFEGQFRDGDVQLALDLLVLAVLFIGYLGLVHGRARLFLGLGEFAHPVFRHQLLKADAALRLHEFRLRRIDQATDVVGLDIRHVQDVLCYDFVCHVLSPIQSR
jgi:hypothetical protein